MYFALTYFLTRIIAAAWRGRPPRVRSDLPGKCKNDSDHFQDAVDMKVVVLRN